MSATLHDTLTIDPELGEFLGLLPGVEQTRREFFRIAGATAKSKARADFGRFMRSLRRSGPKDRNCGQAISHRPRRCKPNSDGGLRRGRRFFHGAVGVGIGGKVWKNPEARGTNWPHPDESAEPGRAPGR